MSLYGYLIGQEYWLDKIHFGMGYHYVYFAFEHIAAAYSTEIFGFS